MKTRTSKKTIWARSLLFLPVLAGLFYGFSTKEVVELETENSIPAVENSETLELKMDGEGKLYQNNKVISLAEVKNLNWKNYTNYTISISPDVSKIIEKEFVTLVVNQGIGGTITVCAVNEAESANSQEKATPEMVAEYNKMAKHYNSISSEEGTPVKKKDHERMKYIYNLMTPEQKKKSESFPVLSPPPPPNKNMVAEYNRLVKHYNEMPEDKRIIKQEDLNRIMFIRSIMSPEQKENAEKIKFDVPPPPPPAIEHPQNHPPPPPPPPIYEDLVEKDATFYYKDKIITPEEAWRLVRVEKSVNGEIIDIDTKPVVILTDKEKK